MTWISSFFDSEKAKMLKCIMHQDPDIRYKEYVPLNSCILPHITHSHNSIIILFLAFTYALILFTISFTAWYLHFISRYDTMITIEWAWYDYTFDYDYTHYMIWICLISYIYILFLDMSGLLHHQNCSLFEYVRLFVPCSFLSKHNITWKWFLLMKLTLFFAWWLSCGKLHMHPFLSLNISLFSALRTVEPREEM